MEASKNITIIGCGRLGLCAALIFERKGYNVMGVDLEQSYCDSINNKTLKSYEPQVEEYLAQARNLHLTTSLSEALEFADIVFIFVDTTGVGLNSYDHSKVEHVLQQINSHKVSNKHLIVGSTVSPGFNNSAKAFLNDCTNTSLSYHPEFIAQGSIIHDFLHPDIVLIGTDDEDCAKILMHLLNQVVENTPEYCVMDPLSAEITKLGLNCFLTMKITFSNLIGDIADRCGAQKFSIMNAIGKDSRIGSKFTKPGYGYGGPCLPRDNQALAAYAQSIGIDSVLLNATDTYNKIHNQILTQNLLEKQQNRFVFENVAYKENCPVPIIDESQKLLIAQSLASQGKHVTIKDTPQVIEVVRRKYGNIFDYETK